MLGMFQAFTPKFVKKYANLADVTVKAMVDYVNDVKGMKFPEDEHSYTMVEGEKEKLDQLVQPVLQG
jgi:3-methyl-2-oxobutanoate hydroxymethyltransferase